MRQGVTETAVCRKKNPFICHCVAGSCLLLRHSIARTQIDEGVDLDEIQSRDRLANGALIRTQGGKKSRMHLCNV
jgi:hypothetical protein